MKISILSPDLSNNCLGRAYILAKILQRRYNVEIVGPLFGKEIWKPVANDRSMLYKSIKIRGMFKPYLEISNLFRKIDGDVIYASKPLLTSFGVGLFKNISSDKPLILDIDDWQLGIIKGYYNNVSLGNLLKLSISSIILFYKLNSYLNIWFMEKLIKFTDKVTVSNHYLQRRFGGDIIWHARDTEVFDPLRFDKDSIKEKFGLSKYNRIIIFLGTPRLHKGIEDLIMAVRQVKNKDATLLLVGISADEYCQGLVRMGKEMLNRRFFVFGLQSFENIPEFLSMADIAVIPQKKNLATVGQIPAKVFDAMAMAKPIIATCVSDLPSVLNGCGWIVEPGNVDELAETIQYVLNHEEEAEETGRRARQKCIEKYSWDAMEKILMKIFGKYEK